jgi:NitT/TauT family transport system ATP-binding protein
MKQRVALARALAQDRDVLLMDEPFAALDAVTRDLLHDELERVWRETGRTIVFVTHNVREAARLGDRVILMTARGGKIAREWDIDVERPRLIESPAVSTIAGSVSTALRAELAKVTNV